MSLTQGERPLVALNGQGSFWRKKSLRAELEKAISGIVNATAAGANEAFCAGSDDLLGFFRRAIGGLGGPAERAAHVRQSAQDPGDARGG